MLVIKQARLYAPEPKGIQDILVEGGKIVRISPSINEYDGIGEVEKLQLYGRRLAPGYIDCHEHITGGGGEQGEGFCFRSCSDKGLFACTRRAEPRSSGTL